VCHTAVSASRATVKPPSWEHVWCLSQSSAELLTLR
jgi:hypothetical protein